MRTRARLALILAFVALFALGVAFGAWVAP